MDADPDYLEARLALADVLRGLGRAEEAMSEGNERILRDHPHTADGELGLAMSLAIVGRLDEAQARFREGTRRHPDRPEFADALRHLGSQMNSQ